MTGGSGKYASEPGKIIWQPSFSPKLLANQNWTGSKLIMQHSEVMAKLYDLKNLLLVASSSSASTNCRVSSGVNSSRMPGGGTVSAKDCMLLLKCWNLPGVIICVPQSMWLYLVPWERLAMTLYLSCLIRSSFEISFTYSRLSWHRLNCGAALELVKHSHWLINHFIVREVYVVCVVLLLKTINGTIADQDLQTKFLRF